MIETRMTLWSAGTCHRFFNGRLVALTQRDKSRPAKATTSCRTPNASLAHPDFNHNLGGVGSESPRALISAAKKTTESTGDTPGDAVHRRRSILWLAWLSVIPPGF